MNSVRPSSIAEYKQESVKQQRSQMSGLEKTFTYLEATYEELIPGQKRELKNKMDQCRKDYQEIRQTFMKQDQATET